MTSSDLVDGSVNLIDASTCHDPETPSKMVHDPADTEPAAQPSAWFAGIRSRISAALSMSDWLNQLGIGTHPMSSKSKSNTTAAGDSSNLRDKIRQNPNSYDFSPSTIRYERAQPPVGEQRGVRSRSVDPMECAVEPADCLDYENVMFDSATLSPIVSPTADVLTPVAVGNNPANVSPANFWLNLETGRNYKDTLELQHFGPLADLIPIGNKEPARGHDFQTLRLVNPTWCDKCGDFIMGFVKQALRCSFCNYTCHYKCRALVTLDCRSLQDHVDEHNSVSTPSTIYCTAKSDFLSSAPDYESVSGVVDSDDLWSDKMTEITDMLTESDIVEASGSGVGNLGEDWPGDEGDPVSGELLRKAIDDYNAQCNGLGVTLHENNLTFSGYIQIHMNFTRPINIVAGQRAPSVYDVMGNGVNTMASSMDGSNARRTIVSFFLPRQTVKTLHIDSETSTREMIVTLLRKFKVADNPRKFALYERRMSQHTETLKSKLYRVSDEAFPLRLALHWGAASGRRFVLQENETGDILWEAFEVPELNNFLKILELEEQQYLWQIRQRYNLLRHRLVTEMRERGWSSDAIQNVHTSKLHRQDTYNIQTTDPMPDELADNFMASLDDLKLDESEKNAMRIQPSATSSLKTRSSNTTTRQIDDQTL